MVLASQAAGRVQHAGVLDDRGHEARATAQGAGAGRAAAVQKGQDRVVGLGAAAHEEDFVGVCADERGDLFPRLFDFFPGLTSEAVHAGRIAEYFKPLDQGLFYVRMQGRGGVVVKIDISIFHEKLLDSRNYDQTLIPNPGLSTLKMDESCLEQQVPLLCLFHATVHPPRNTAGAG